MRYYFVQQTDTFWNVLREDDGLYTWIDAENEGDGYAEFLEWNKDNTTETITLTEAISLQQSQIEEKLPKEKP